jgi:hypothetical protein
MEIYLGKNTLEIERGFNNVSVVFKYSQDDRKEVEDNEILLYTTDRFICDYDFETGLKHMTIRNTYGGLISGLPPSRKYFLKKKLNSHMVVKNHHHLIVIFMMLSKWIPYK